MELVDKMVNTLLREKKKHAYTIALVRVYPGVMVESSYLLIFLWNAQIMIYIQLFLDFRLINLTQKLVSFSPMFLESIHSNYPHEWIC